MSRSSASRNSLSQRMSQVSLNKRTSSFGIQPTKDPRPIRDKAWQQSATASLIAFLAQAGYPHPVSKKNLVAPSQKDFINMFTFLYGLLDPNFEWKGRFDDDFTLVLKGLRYPFEISKSQLQSVGSMHAWPSLLACLDQLNANNVANDDFAIQEEQAERIFYAYLIQTYHGFLAGEDDFEKMDADLMQKFDKRNEVVLAAIEKLKKKNAALEKEWTALDGSEPPLTIAQREQETLLSDLAKFNEYIQLIQQRTLKSQEQISNLKATLSDHESQLDKKLQEKASLIARIDAQPISPADVDRMNNERDSLVLAVSTLDAKLVEINDRVFKSEIEIQKFMDIVDASVKTFNDLAYKLGLVEFKVGKEVVKFELGFQMHAEKMSEMVNLDLKKTVKPLLNKNRTNIKNEIHKLQDESILVSENEHTVSESFAELNQELSEISNELLMMNQKYAEQKEATGNAITQLSQEKLSLVTECQSMTNDFSLRLANSHRIAQEKSIAYEKRVREVELVTENYSKLLYKSVEDYIEYANQVEVELENLKALVDGEYEDEVAKGELFEAEI